MVIIIFILIFGIIIAVHELGHFIAAKSCGVFVEEFAIGMGYSIFSLKKKDTLYSIRILPFGGYCKMKNEDEKSDDEDSFSNATKLKKFIILFAGAFMNFLLAVFIFFIISLFSYISTTNIESVAENSPAYEAGLQAGDKIYKINDKRVRIFEDISYLIQLEGDSTIKMTVERDNELLDFYVTPSLQDGSYIIGIYSNAKAPFISKGYEGLEKSTFFEAIYNGYWKTVFTVKSIFEGLIDLVSFNVELKDITGPIGLAPIIGETYAEAITYGIKSVILTMLNLTAILSFNIGIINLLPIPALDGGRILFLFIELIRRKPIPPEKEGVIHFVSFVILIAFGILIAFKDLFAIF